jgi:hypothetical protein
LETENVFQKGFYILGGNRSNDFKSWVRRTSIFMTDSDKSIHKTKSISPVMVGGAPNPYAFDSHFFGGDNVSAFITKDTLLEFLMGYNKFSEAKALEFMDSLVARGILYVKPNGMLVKLPKVEAKTSLDVVWNAVGLKRPTS